MRCVRIQLDEEPLQSFLLIWAAAVSNSPVALLVIHPLAIWVKIKLVIKVFKKPLTILIKLCVFQMTPGLPRKRNN